MSQDKKDKIKEYQKKKYQELVQYNKEVLKNKRCFVFSLIQKMSEKTLKFNKISVNKKEFHKSKQPIDLMSVNVDQIVVSDKLKHGDEGFKYFIGYQTNKVKLLNGYALSYLIRVDLSNTLKTGAKACLFLIKDDEV